MLKLVLRSAGAKLVTLPVSAVCGLLVTGIYIHSAGVEGFAAISIVATIFLLIPFADLGMGVGVVNVFASTEEGSARRPAVVISALRVLLPVAGVIMLVAIAGATIFSWTRVLGIDESLIGNMDVVTAAALALFGAALPMGLGQRVLLGVNKNHLAVILNSLASVVTLGVAATMAGLGIDPRWFATSPVAGLVVASLLGSAFASRFVRLELRQLFDVRHVAERGLVSSGAWMMLISGGSAVVFHAGRMILGHASNAVEVAQYSLAMQFFVPINGLMLAAGFALWPLLARHPDERRRAIVLRFQVGFLVAGLTIGVVLIALGGPFGRVISGGEIDLDRTLLVSFAALITVQFAQIVPGMSLMSPSGLVFQGLVSIPCTLAFVVSAWFLRESITAWMVALLAAVMILLFQLVPTSIRVYRAPRG